jgi:hypothetical protein
MPNFQRTTTDTRWTSTCSRWPSPAGPAIPSRAPSRTSRRGWQRSAVHWQTLTAVCRRLATTMAGCCSRCAAGLRPMQVTRWRWPPHCSAGRNWRSVPHRKRRCGCWTVKSRPWPPNLPERPPHGFFQTRAMQSSVLRAATRFSMRGVTDFSTQATPTQMLCLSPCRSADDRC